MNEMQRDAIWQLMGKDRRRYTERDYDSDESDMEASGAAVLAEERRAYVQKLPSSVPLPRLLC